MISDQPIHLEPGGGQRFNVLGASYTIKLPGSASGGAFCLVEALSPPGSGVPRHVHHREQETFFILEGSLEIKCAGKQFAAEAGSTVLLPRDVPHGYRNAGVVPARYLILLQPAGFEGFFEDASKLPQEGPPDLARLMAIGRRYGLQLLLPGA